MLVSRDVGGVVRRRGEIEAVIIGSADFARRVYTYMFVCVLLGGEGT